MSLSVEEAKRLQELRAKYGALDSAAEIPTEPKPERASEPWYEDMAEGVVLSGMQTAYGIKDLFSPLSDKEKERLNDWKEDAGQSGWGTAGQVVGEIGQLAIPGGALTKTLKVAGKAKNLSKGAMAASRAIGDVGAAAGLGALQAPGEGESRGRNALEYGEAALLGEGLGYVGGKLIHGINKTPQAQRLLDSGVRLTPGQASGNNFIQGVESAAEVTPLVAEGVKRARRLASDDSADFVWRTAAAPGKKVTKTGYEGVQQLKKGFQEAYEEAWSGANDLALDAKLKMVNRMASERPYLTDDQLRVMERMGTEFKKLTGNPSPKSLNAFDNHLRKRIGASKNDYDFQEFLIALRNDLREGMPGEVAEKLKAIDGQYGKYLVIRRAAKNAMDKEGVSGPKQLVSAVKAIGKDKAGEGTAPLQREAMDIVQTVGNEVGGQPLEWFRRLAGITKTPIPMQAGGRAVLGRTLAQKGAQKVSRQVPDYLKRPGLAGAAALGPDEERRY